MVGAGEGPAGGAVVRGAITGGFGIEFGGLPDFGIFSSTGLGFGLRSGGRSADGGRGVTWMWPAASMWRSRAASPGRDWSWYPASCAICRE